MSDIKWIKLSVSMFDDEKIKLIEKMPDGDSLIVIWVKLLAIAGRCNLSGYIMLTESIPYTEDMLIAVIDRPITTIRLALTTFEKFGMIERTENEAFFISNWEKHQNIDGMERVREQARIRMAKHREKAKVIALCNVTSDVTSDGDVTPSYVPDIEEELEEDIDITHQVDEKVRFIQMAEYFYTKVKDHAEANKVAHLIRKPNFSKWGDEFRKIVKLDKRNLQELQAIIDWATSDPFWSKNILSPKKLREKYTDLGVKMYSDTSKVGKSTKSNRNKDLLKQKMEEARNEQGPDVGTTGSNIFSLPES